MMSTYNDKHTQNGGSLHLSTTRGMKDGRYHLDRGSPRSSEWGKSDFQSISCSRFKIELYFNALVVVTAK